MNASPVGLIARSLAPHPPSPFRDCTAGKASDMADDEQDQAEALDEDKMIGDYPADRLLGANQYGITAAEDRWDEPLEERIAREEPDFGEADPAAVDDGVQLAGGDPVDGLLVGEAVPGVDTDLIEAGVIAFGDTTLRDVATEREAPVAAEEAAVHVIEE